MKVELSIRDDKELRDMIKDLIRGQVVNVTIKKILVESVSNSSIKACLIASAEQKAKDVTREYVQEALGGYNRSRLIKDMVKDHIASEVNIVLKEMK